IPRTTMYRPAPEVVYELIPGWQGRGPFREHIHINRAGLRGSEIDAKRGGTFRIVAFGDSFTFGIGVAEDDTFPVALGRALGGDDNVEVLNGGVPGYNLFQETRALAARAAAFEPDLIVLG